jgi:hypothetical protein
MSERAFKNVIRATALAVANRWLDEPGAIKAAPTV